MTSVCWVDTIASHHMNVVTPRDHLDVISREQLPHPRQLQRRQHNDRRQQQNVPTSTHPTRRLKHTRKPILIDILPGLQQRYQGIRTMIEIMANAVRAFDEIAKALVQVSLILIMEASNTHL